MQGPPRCPPLLGCSLKVRAALRGLYGPQCTDIYEEGPDPGGKR